MACISTQQCTQHSMLPPVLVLAALGHAMRMCHLHQHFDVACLINTALIRGQGLGCVQLANQRQVGELRRGRKGRQRADAQELDIQHMLRLLGTRSCSETMLS